MNLIDSTQPVIPTEWFVGGASPSEHRSNQLFPPSGSSAEPLLQSIDLL